MWLKSFQNNFPIYKLNESSLSSPNVEFLDNLAEYSSHLLISLSHIKIKNNKIVIINKAASHTYFLKWRSPVCF